METRICLICAKIIKDANDGIESSAGSPHPSAFSPYSICYDLSYKTNVWGGDSHEYVGYICEECGAKLKAKAQINKDEPA